MEIACRQLPASDNANLEPKNKWIIESNNDQCCGQNAILQFAQHSDCELHIIGHVVLYVFIAAQIFGPGRISCNLHSN